MINILSYVGMNLQSEVCLWALLGLMRTIFDATLFKVNANLKQVWQMTMPEELTMPVQRVLRTMISGVMLVQCFTVYVYLASYIVLLYPVFLEERPTLVLPWLLLAAVRKLLCELTSLALGLGTCVLLGPARPPCIRFVVVKFTSIMPAFYMWMLVFSYYHALKVASAFKTFPAVLPPNDHDYGLELAVRRRCTKSLLGEEQLRKKLVANFYGEGARSMTNQQFLCPSLEISSKNIIAAEDSTEEISSPVADASKPLTMSTTGWSDHGAYEDWFGNEVIIPRDTDRILEQIVLMLLRIGAYLKKERVESVINPQIINSTEPALWNIDCADDSETPPLVGSSKGNMASYLREYPQIFMKKKSTDISALNNDNITALKTVQSHVETEEANLCRNRNTPGTSNETVSSDIEHITSKKIINTPDNKNTNDELIMSKQVKTSQTEKTSERKRHKRHKRKRNNSLTHPQDNENEIANKMKNSAMQGNKVSWNEEYNLYSLDATTSRAINSHNSEHNSEETENDEAEKSETASSKKPKQD